MMPQRSASQSRLVGESIPAPIGGWNARDAVDLMPPTDAIYLDNWFPDSSVCQLRRGSNVHASGMTGAIESLMEYAGGSTRKLFAAAGTGIYDVSSSGAVGSPVVSGTANNRWQHVNFGTPGGQFLWCCNGGDTPRTFDGSAWATVSITGVTPTDIINVTVHKRRLFFVLNDSLKFGYLPLNSISGAAATFDLASELDMGGKLVAIGTWSRDGGRGADDLICFISDQGQVAVYNGSDPGSATDWSIVGTFNIAPPIGRRCVHKVGADLFIITIDGYIPLSQMLPADRTNVAGAVSDKIIGAVRERAGLQKNTFGWQIMTYPGGNYGLVNVPAGSNVFEQHIVNLTTGSWCRFTGQNGVCWSLFDDALFFGGADGNVYQADVGSSDNGAAIVGVGKPAFNYMQSRGSSKIFRLARPVFSAEGEIPVSIGFDTDFNDGSEFYTPVSVETSSGASWNEADWDAADWGGSSKPDTSWRSIPGHGYCGSLRIRTSTSQQRPKWHSWDVKFEIGHGL